MSYDLHFVGLICFTHFGNGLRVLLPDGRRLKHAAAIVAREPAVLDYEWSPQPKNGVFFITKQTALTFTGTFEAGEMKKDEWRHLPNLHQLNPQFKLAEKPGTIATSFITNGTFTVWEHPNGEADAFVSSLSVPWSGRIRVQAGDSFIRFNAQTELALANIEKSYLDGKDLAQNDKEHFQIYKKLARVDPGELELPWGNKRPKLDSEHPVFRGKPMLKIGCSNTGCC